MVAPARKTPRAGQLRYLNQPRPLRVLTDARGAPRAVVIDRKAQPVTRLRDRWRIDDTWWREPLCRMYWELELGEGRIMTLYQDQTTGQWFEQPYGV